MVELKRLFPTAMRRKVTLGLLPILVAIHLLAFLDLLHVLPGVLSKGPFLCSLDTDNHHDESRKEADQRRTGISC